MRLRFTPRARADIEGIFDHLNQISPSGAGHVLRDVHASLQHIADQPEGTPRTDLPDVRVRIVRRYRYKIFYRIADDAVDVLHVRHSSRRPWRGPEDR